MVKTLIVIVGPTAIGKTSLSLAFAKAYNTSIISCDSRQLYKEMNIGTAVPTQEELSQAPHYFIQNKSIHDQYSVGDFEKEAIAVLDQLFKKKDVVIVVGGSALYEKAITHGLDELPDIPAAIRENLKKEYEEKGLGWLQAQVEEVDSTFFKTTDIENPRRLLRALEIYRTTGSKISDLQNNSAKKRDFKILKVGLEADREILYSRIDKRVDLMLENGLESEARKVAQFEGLPALSTVGYQEFFPYFKGNYSKNEAIRLIKRNTRRFAKRQMTWYRKDTEVIFFPYLTRHIEIIRRVDKLMENTGI